MVTEETRKKYATVKDKAPVIDVTKAGYFKVLGRGRLPHQPIVVKAKFFSKTAERRIKAQQLEEKLQKLQQHRKVETQVRMKTMEEKSAKIKQVKEI